MVTVEPRWVEPRVGGGRRQTVGERELAYVRGKAIDDPEVAHVFEAIAARTQPSRDEGADTIMGLDLHDADIPDLAAGIGLDGEQFRAALRRLRHHVRMNVGEHADGIWEIVYGPAFDKPRMPTREEVDQAARHGPQPFWMPGWDAYSIWGYDTDLSDGSHYLFAQLYRNDDDRDGPPRIWITPPDHMPRTRAELAEAIAARLGKHEIVPIPPVAIDDWLTRPR